MGSKELMFQEVNKIRDSSIKRFTIEAFDAASEKFWRVAASSSGKFHPPEDNGDGGLVRHLVKASYIAEQFGRKAMFSEYEIDIARASTILHDICKDGNPWGENTDYRHGIIGAEYLSHFKLEDNNAKELIMNGVRYHMSPWNTALSPEKYFLLTGKGGAMQDGVTITIEEIRKELEEVKRGLTPHSIIERCVQEADYWSSRNGMSFMPGIAVDLSRHDIC